MPEWFSITRRNEGIFQSYGVDNKEIKSSKLLIRKIVIYYSRGRQACNYQLSGELGDQINKMIMVLSLGKKRRK